MALNPKVVQNRIKALSSTGIFNDEAFRNAIFTQARSLGLPWALELAHDQLGPTDPMTADVPRKQVSGNSPFDTAVNAPDLRQPGISGATAPHAELRNKGTEGFQTTPDNGLVNQTGTRVMPPVPTNENEKGVLPNLRQNSQVTPVGKRMIVRSPMPTTAADYMDRQVPGVEGLDPERNNVPPGRSNFPARRKSVFLPH